MLNGSQNPMGMMQQMFGNNPMMSRAMQMSQGKSPQELQQVVMNLAQQRGISQEQLQQMMNQFGLKM